MLKFNPSQKVSKFLERIPEKHAHQIGRKIAALCINPLPNDMKKVLGTNFLRVDSGEYRIIYYVEDNVLQVVLVGNRNDGKVYPPSQETVSVSSRVNAKLS